MFGHFCIVHYVKWLGSRKTTLIYRLAFSIFALENEFFLKSPRKIEEMAFRVENIRYMTKDDLSSVPEEYQEEVAMEADRLKRDEYVIGSLIGKKKTYTIIHGYPGCKGADGIIVDSKGVIRSHIGEQCDEDNKFTRWYKSLEGDLRVFRVDDVRGFEVKPVADERKQHIETLFGFICENMADYDLKRACSEYWNFATYKEFTTFQHKCLEGLSEKHLERLLSLQMMIEDPILQVHTMDKESMAPFECSGFAFDLRERLVVFNER